MKKLKLQKQSKTSVKQTKNTRFSFPDRNILFLGLILIFTFLLFSKSLHYEFLSWDDDKQITDNTLIKKIDKNTFQELYKFDKHTSLTLLTYALNYNISQQDPFSYRLINLLLHLINIILVFALIQTILKNKKIALIAALLFALHPMRVESVVWISERKDLLFTLLSLSSLLLYIEYLKNNKPVIFILSFLIGYLASLAKIQAIALPVLFLSLDIYYSRKISYLLIYEKLLLFYFLIFFHFNFYIQHAGKFRMPFFFLLWALLFYSVNYIQNNTSTKKKIVIGLAIIICCIIIKEHVILIPITLWWIYDTYKNKINLHNTFQNIFVKNKYWIISLCTLSLVLILFLQNKISFWHTEEISNKTFHFIDRIFLASYSLSFYITKAVAPFNLNAIYSYPVKSHGLLPSEYYISLLLILLFLSSWIWLYFKKIQSFKKEILFFFLFFIINISLVLHIIPIEGRLVTSDRYSYFAYLGIFALAGIGFENIYTKIQTVSNKKIITGIACCILITYSIITFLRIPVWKNNFTLFEDVLLKNPDISFAHSNLGGAYMHTWNKQKTFYHLNRAILLDTNFNMAFYNRAMAYFQFKQYKEAITDINKLLTLHKDSFDLAIDYNDRAMIRLETGDINGAWKDLDVSLKYNSKSAKAYNNRSKIRYISNQLDSAIIDCNTALSINPDLDEGYTNRGWCWVLKGHANMAMDNFDKAVKLNPRNEKALTNRGTLKINMKDLNGAINDLSAAIKVNSNFEIAYSNRGYAWFIMGKYENTVLDYSKAIQLNPKNAEYYTNRGWAYLKKGELNNALHDYNKAAEIQPKNDVIFANRSWIKIQLKDTTGALDDISKAIQLNNKSEKALLNSAIINFNLKKITLAIEHLDRLIAINNKNGEAYYYRGTYKLQQRKNKEACSDFSLAINNGYIQAKEMFTKNCK